MVHPSPFLDPTFGVTPTDISPPKGEMICPDDRSIVMQTVTSIGGTCAEIYVPGVTHRQIHLQQILIYDKTPHTSVAFVV